MIEKQTPVQHADVQLSGPRNHVHVCSSPVDADNILAVAGQHAPRLAEAVRGSAQVVT